MFKHIRLGDMFTLFSLARGLWDPCHFDIFEFTETKKLLGLVIKTHPSAIWVFPKMVVPPKHPKMIIFSRKTLVVGYHLFRKPSYCTKQKNFAENKVIWRSKFMICWSTLSKTDSFLMKIGLSKRKGSSPNHHMAGAFAVGFCCCFIWIFLTSLHPNPS